LGWCYAPQAGSLVVTGAMPGHANETLLSMDCNHCKLLLPVGWGSYTLEPMPIIGAPALSANVTSAFGGSGGLGKFSIEFSATGPGAAATLDAVTIGAQAEDPGVAVAMDETFTGPAGTHLSGRAASPTPNGSVVYADLAGLGAIKYGPSGGGVADTITGTAALVSYPMTGVSMVRTISGFFTALDSADTDYFETPRPSRQEFDLTGSPASS
jgi:hypothetical protein